jgi:hypothetical protein
MYNFAVITDRACNVYNWKNEIVFVSFQRCGCPVGIQQAVVPD